MANLCNFTKVILDRCTSHENKQKLSKREHFNKYNSSVTSNLHLDFSKFQAYVPRVHQFLSKSASFVNYNKNNERRTFLEAFTLDKWTQLSESQQKEHSLADCSACEDIEVALFDVQESCTSTSPQIRSLSSIIQKSKSKESAVKSIIAQAESSGFVSLF